MTNQLEMVIINNQSSPICYKLCDNRNAIKVYDSCLWEPNCILPTCLSLITKYVDNKDSEETEIEFLV
ncbi:hypothetical protein GVAV_002178 [Gurleya vavrai]